LIWDEIASGLLQGERAMSALEHASTCAGCAALLKSSLELFEPEAEVSPPARSHPPIWTWLAAAAVIILGIGTVVLWRMRSSDPLHLLTAAYSSDRTMDLRLPGAPYGPLRLQRGSASQIPTAAIEAQLSFRRSLERNPDDPAALHARGRWELLYGDPDRAIQSLEAARDLAGNKPDPDLLTETGMAYRQRAIRNQTSTDQMHAVELFGQALVADPDHRAARFNRGMVEGELDLLTPAIEDLEHLLKLEPSGQWSEETRAALNRLRKNHAVFFNRPAGADETNFDEAALDRMLQDPGGTGLGELASRLETHHDFWIADVANLAKSRENQQAEEELARMAHIRITYRTAKYADEKQRFDALYQMHLAPALAVWRDFEALYRATHARGEFHCTEAVLAEPQAARYPWLATQISREAAMCSIQAGDADLALAELKSSLALAETSRFPVSRVRSVGAQAGVEWRRGLYRGTMDLAGTELRSVFAHAYPVARTQELYNILMISAEDLGWWHAARAAAAQMTEAATAAGFRDLEFTDTVHWAQLCLRDHDPGEARRHFSDAVAYAAQTPVRPATLAWAEIGLAEATGDDARLLTVANQLEHSGDPMIWIPYERVRTSLALSAQRLPEAHAHLDRIARWIYSPEPSAPWRDKQWYGEFRSARELQLQLLLQEGQDAEAFRQLQRWRSAEESSISGGPVHPAFASDRDAVKFALLEIGDRVGVWRCDRGAIDFRWAIEPVSKIAPLVRRLERLLESAQSSVAAIDACARRIAADLFGAWLDQIEPDRPAVIQSGDALAALPFAALPAADGYLGLKHPVAVTPFAFADRESPRNLPPGNLVLIDASAGNPNWAPELPALPSGSEEVAGIQRVSSMPATVLGPGPISQQELARSAASASVVHFVGHSIETTSGAGLVIPGISGPVLFRALAPQGEEIAPTVILSACSTGRRDLQDSAGASSFATRILLEGSAQVIASLWNVDSEAAAEFMSEFYRRLGTGPTGGQALQSAMQSLAKSGRFSHPYYWAMFTRFVRE
jgi:hypothetical protein